MKSTWEAELSIYKMVKAGTTIKLPYVWSHTPGGTTDPKDIEFKLEEDMHLGEAMEQLEALALDYVKSQGAEDIRHYFIESAEHVGDTILLSWGT